MALSVGYVRRETLASLKRNRLMSLAAVLTVAVSLSLVGVALLLQQGVSNATVRWSNGVDVAVFLQPTVSATQKTAVDAELKGLPTVKRCFYMGKQRSYAEMKRLYANQPDVYQSLTPAEMPPSYRCVLTNPKDAATVQAQFSKQPGVRNVIYPGQQIKTMEKVSSILQIIFVSLAAVLFLSAFVLIANTIRLAIFSRRREVAVMKLVGATNWFIRVPFMLEGMVQGLFGGIIAFGVILMLHWGLSYTVAHASAQNILQSVVISDGAAIATSIGVLLLGATMGGVGSFIAIRRFLEV